MINLFQASLLIFTFSFYLFLFTSFLLSFFLNSLPLSLIFSFLFSATTLLLSLSLAILPFSNAILLQCSFGLVWTLAENWSLCLSANCLAKFPTWISISLIVTILFSWFAIVASMDFSKASSNLFSLSVTEGYRGCCCCWKGPCLLDGPLS